MRPTQPPSAERAHRYVEAGHWRNACVAEFLQRCAGRLPERVAVVDGERRTTFAELDRQAWFLAGALLDLDLAPGDVVSFQLPNWLERQDPEVRPAGLRRPADPAALNRAGAAQGRA